MESVQKSVDVPGGTCSSATIVWAGYPPGASHFLAESRDSGYLGRENRYVPYPYATDSRLVDLIGKVLAFDAEGLLGLGEAPGAGAFRRAGRRAGT